MTFLERHTWLYTQGEASIRITRNMRGLVLFVCGPGAATETHTFKDHASFNDFLREFLARLERDGWVLHATVDRRQESAASRPDGADRRRRTP